MSKWGYKQKDGSVKIITASTEAQKKREAIGGGSKWFYKKEIEEMMKKAEEAEPKKAEPETKPEAEPEANKGKGNKKK